MQTSRRWYRIDSKNGQITEVTADHAYHASMHAFIDPRRAMTAGRFATQHAIYSTGDQITAAERAAGEAFNQRVGMVTR